jgi:hypothetical protein
MTNTDVSKLIADAMATEGLEQGLRSSQAARSTDLDAITAAIFAGTGRNTDPRYLHGLALARELRRTQCYDTWREA